MNQKYKYYMFSHQHAHCTIEHFSLGRTYMFRGRHKLILHSVVKVNVLKFSTVFSLFSHCFLIVFSNKTLVYQGLNSQNAGQNSK